MSIPAGILAPQRKKGRPVANAQPIHISTQFGTLEFCPEGKLLEVLNAQTPKNRAALEAHIAQQLSQGVLSIWRFGLSSQEFINETLDSQAALKAEKASSEMWDNILSKR